MPIDEPSAGAIAMTAGFGALAAGALTVPNSMPRRQVWYLVITGTLCAATIPQVAEVCFGVHPVARWLMGVICGLSGPLIVVKLQKWTATKADEMTGGSS